jgi:hypothetical protein
MFTREERLPLARCQPEALVEMILVLQAGLEPLEQRVKELEARLASSRRERRNLEMATMEMVTP